MHVILEILLAPETDQLSYRYGDQFSKPRSGARKKSETEMYGEGYFYRNVAKEFGIGDEEDIQIMTAQGKILWST